MKAIPLKKQVFKIPVVFVGLFILNILMMTWGLYLRHGYSDYLLVILSGCFFIVPPLFAFVFFYKVLKKLQEDKKHYWRFIIRNAKRSLVLYLILCIAGHVIVEHLSSGLVITATVTATGIWVSTAVFIMLSISVLKPHIEILDTDIDISEGTKINPANGAPMIGNTDIYGNPSGFNYSQWEDD